MRARLVDEARRLGSWENPCSANPGRGCGMKQAYKVLEGVTRRERAKRCGRNIGEVGNLADLWTSCTGVANGNRTLGGVWRLRQAGDLQDVL